MSDVSLSLSFSSLHAAELEFVQIIIIIVVMTVMVVVIICLLSHYKLSTWSFITRQSQARRHDHAPQQVSNRGRRRCRSLFPTDVSIETCQSLRLFSPSVPAYSL